MIAMFSRSDCFLYDCLTSLFQFSVWQLGLRQAPALMACRLTMTALAAVALGPPCCDAASNRSVSFWYAPGSYGGEDINVCTLR
jgi:hypothetical protein